MARIGLSTHATMIPALANAYGSALSAAIFSESRQKSGDRAANAADTVSISEAGRQLSLQAADDDAGRAEAAVATPDPIDIRLSIIQATPPSQRSAADLEYLRTHDPRLAAIERKSVEQPGSLTPIELAYRQKATAIVDTVVD